jgi:hypothetical protein
MVSYHLPCHWGASPQTARRRSHQAPMYTLIQMGIHPSELGRGPWIHSRTHQAPMDSLIQRGIHPPGESGWGPQIHNEIQEGIGTSKGKGAPLIRLVRTQVQIQACPRKQKESLITSQWDILVTAILWEETMSLRFREQYGSTVLYDSIRKCELRHSPAAK